jgi:integrase
MEIAPMAVVTLTDKRVAAVRPPKAGRSELWDKLEPGLALRVTEKDARTWTLKIWVGAPDTRKQRRINLGHPRPRDGKPVLTLAQARQKARDVKKLAAEGKPLTPDDSVQNPDKALTFKALVADYLKHLADNERASTVKEATRILVTHADLKNWQDLPLSKITDDEVRKLRDSIADRGAEIQSNRTLARLHALFNWALDEKRIATSPAAGIKKRTSEEERDRVLSDEELRWFWAGCTELGWPFGPLCQLLALTAQRRDEVGGMRWSEIDLAERRWVLPRQRAKNDQAHEVHLSDAAIDILTGLAEQRGKIAMLKASDFVFPTSGGPAVSGFSWAKTRLDDEMRKARRRALSQPEDDDEMRKALGIPDGRALPVEIERWTLHDLRRTAATGMARLKIAPHVVDKVLNHTSGTIRGVAKVYNRFAYLEERAAALDAWSRFVMSLVNEKRQTNVVPLRKGDSQVPA